MFDNLKPILKTPSVVDELSGKFFYKKSVKNLSWFKAGGVLEYLYIPKNEKVTEKIEGDSDTIVSKIMEILKNKLKVV